ncbi:hypothetical protein GCM10009841_27780 [Microlunatus panaciterrae]|uniref:Streptogramin lyase n=1 Tax=Microlunatus panaciterrae TaxID=400768 RepID=A0ABS2RN19_9ACTN|nr:superoxide dismutase [Microlunatus panaciterrae]MBM7799591.1 streptogramin lyase [Microlunatus panaciterrae]
MTARSTLRLLWTAVLAALLSLALAGTAVAHPGSPHRTVFPTRIALPDGFQPEGITVGKGAVAYLGSLVDGDIYAANLRTGAGKVISQGPGTPAVGLKADRRGRLFVAGGPAGNGRVVDIRTGRTLRTYSFTTGASFVNDVVIAGRTVWFTDSQQAQLYGLPLGRHGRLPASSKVIRLTLTGDWVQQAGFNANGIVTTPDRRGLLVVQSTTGYLFRVNQRTGVATRVDLGGTLLQNGDGLLRQGRRLYVVQNQLNSVAVLTLNHSGTRARLVDRLTSPDFDIPTTVASFGRSLYLPNARFNTPPTPQTHYWVSRLTR